MNGQTLRSFLSILSNVEHLRGGRGDEPFHDITLDSRECRAGMVFFGVPGGRVDGRRFLRELPEGSVAICERRGFEAEWLEGVTAAVYLVDDAQRGAVKFAEKFFVPDFHSVRSVAVTGTNGKTTVAWIVAQALSFLEGGAMYSGTLGVKFFREGEGQWEEETNLTTPDGVTFFRALGRAVKEGARGVVAEVSSHAIAQERLGGVQWEGAVFTNLSRDHLDYHASFEEYGATKARLFLEEPRPEWVATNFDDEWGRRIGEGYCGAKNGEERGCGARRKRCAGFSRFGAEEASVLLESSDGSLEGTELCLKFLGALREEDGVRVRSRLIGDYNRENLMTAVTALKLLGYSSEEVVHAIARVSPVPGRLEPVHPEGEGARGVGVFVDYAHTPDALVRAQRSLRELTSGRLITVFGCGGDRDRGKRPEMARAVALNANIGIVTSDNPRSEDPEAIISDVVKGFEGGSSPTEGFSFKSIPSRREAIVEAIRLASSGDTVLIAGKGHESYQEIKGVRAPFSDQEVARAVFAEKHTP